MEDNYPIGATNDKRAPWNQTDNPEVTVEVEVFNTVKRYAYLAVKDYQELSPDAEKDEEGHVTYSSNKDFSDCDLLDQFESQHYSIKEIFDNLCTVVEDINTSGLTDENLRRLNTLVIKEGACWSKVEEEISII